jgi:hypothetical protein
MVATRAEQMAIYSGSPRAARKAAKMVAPKEHWMVASTAASTEMTMAVPMDTQVALQWDIQRAVQWAD